MTGSYSAARTQRGSGSAASRLNSARPRRFAPPIQATMTDMLTDLIIHKRPPGRPPGWRLLLGLIQRGGLEILASLVIATLVLAAGVVAYHIHQLPGGSA
ncbi:MAG: hypothetical protein ACR2PZ_13775 [Pseudomonadales bacterium]